MVVAALICGPALAQELGLTDGVYSDSQASRGGRIYRQVCSSCHAPNRGGGGWGPGRRGGPCIGPWDGERLAEVMSYMQETMPQDNPGSLSAEDYTDVLAYVLKVNEFPAGDLDLTVESVENIVIESGE